MMPEDEFAHWGWTWFKKHWLTAVLVGIVLWQQLTIAEMSRLLHEERFKREQLEERLMQERKEREEGERRLLDSSITGAFLQSELKHPRK